MSIFCVQGLSVDEEQVSWLQKWIADHPEWSRKRLARELCQLWNWRDRLGGAVTVGRHPPGNEARETGGGPVRQPGGGPLGVLAGSLPLPGLACRWPEHRLSGL